MNPARAINLATMAAGIVLLSGCVEARLRDLEYRQLTGELQQIGDATQYLQGNPQLGQAYNARFFVSGHTLNDALSGLSGLTYPLKGLKGTLTLDSVAFEPRDGAMGLLIKAHAENAKKTLTVSVRIRADLQTSVATSPTGGNLALKPLLREIVPEVKVSIFKFRLWWFVQRLLLVEAQKYVDAIPSLTYALNKNINIDLDGQERRGKITTPDGTITVKFSTPGFHRHYQYSLSRLLYLNEGLYVFLTVRPVP